MAISGLNRLVIADESGALTGRPLASARAAAEQVATEKVTEAKNEIRSVAVQEANQVATEKVAAVKSEAVQAAKDSVQSAVADAIAPVVSTTIPAAVESGVREHAGAVADERIQATVPGMIQSQAATVVESQLSEKLPTAVQAAAGSEITRQIDERVTPTIEAKVSSVITEKSASIKDEVVQSVNSSIDSKIESVVTPKIDSAFGSKSQVLKGDILRTAGSAIDSKIDAAKTDIARDYNSKIPNIVANTVRELGVGDKNYGFADRNISATSYWWPDFWNENTQKGSEWRKLLNTGSSLGIVVLDKASGEWGDTVDDNFLKQGMLAEAAGAKWCAFYLSSRFGAMAEEADAAYREEVRKNLNVTMDKVERATFDRIVQQAKNIVAWYKGEDKIKKVAIFIDEAPSGWSDSQKKVIPWYKRLYLRLKQELGQDVLIVINPGSNTVPEMMEACDVAITYESSASKYIDPETKFIHPDHYKTMPSWRFWHVIHGVTKDNIDAVFATAEKFNIGHLYATDQKFSVGAGNEDEPEDNPYDFAPSDWVVQDTKSWVKGVLPFEQRVSRLETVQVVNNRAYSMPEGTDIAWFFLLNNVTHPQGVTWQTKNGAAPSSGLVILVRAGDHLYGIAPGDIG
nr:MAG TPA: Spherulation-specific family 4 [Caudoviricetes sp.]